jgi:gluconate 2-dehydrogenase gamma chain
MATGRTDETTHVSRRSFIQGSAVVATGVAAACTPGEAEHVRHNGDIMAPDRTPLPPPRTPSPGVYQFLTAAEARTVEAIADRIVPGDQDDPGAVDAGVVTYIDSKLASFEAFAEPTYRSAPYAEPYEGDTPPGPDTDEVIHVPEVELYRYGPQGSMTPQELYRAGIEGLDAYCSQRFGSTFVQLGDDERDEALMVLDAVSQRSEDPEAIEAEGPVPEDDNGVPPDEMDAAEDAFGDVDPGAFFTTVREDTIDGLFADPLYGGNRGLVGWLMVGYPGVQRSYSPREMKEGTNKQPQSLDGLHPMSPDRPDQHAPPALERAREGVVEG